jgi:hypothetical protein
VTVGIQTGKHLRAKPYHLYYWWRHSVDVIYPYGRNAELTEDRDDGWSGEIGARGEDTDGDRSLSIGYVL